MPVGAQNLVFFVRSLKPLVLHSIARLPFTRLKRGSRREDDRQET